MLLQTMYLGTVLNYIPQGKRSGHPVTMPAISNHAKHTFLCNRFKMPCRYCVTISHEGGLV